MSLLGEQALQEARQSAAHAACRACHSALAAQPVLCENAECPAAYARWGASSRLQAADRSLRRLDIF